MSERLLPEIEMLLESLDRGIRHVIPALQALDDEEKLAQSTALLTHLALRLCSFGLGPAGQMNPNQIEGTSLAILDTLRELREDLNAPVRDRPPS
jgi:hypothetical protein